METRRPGAFGFITFDVVLRYYFVMSRFSKDEYLIVQARPNDRLTNLVCLMALVSGFLRRSVSSNLPSHYVDVLWYARGEEKIENGKRGGK